jgi:hypothetical protein
MAFLLIGPLTAPARAQTPAAAPVAPDTSAKRTTIPEYPEKTDHIGSGFGGTLSFDDHAEDDSVQSFGVRWDGDKIRGIRWVYFNGKAQQVGGYDDSKYGLKTYTFRKGELLDTFTLRDSGYGHGSLRSLEFTTSRGKHFAAGPGGFDNQVTPNVKGAALKGFYGIRNPDNFINGLGLWISSPATKILVTHVTYDKNKVQRSKPTMVQLDSGVLDNSQNPYPDNMSLSKSLTYTQEGSWTNSWDLSSTITVSVEAGVPGIASGSLSVSATKSQGTSKSGALSASQSTTVTTSQDVPARKKMRIDFFSSQETITIPFTCDMEVKYANGQTRTLKEFKGVYSGSTSTEITATPAVEKGKSGKTSDGKKPHKKAAD